MKWVSVCGLALFALLLAYLAHEESTFWPRASWTRTSATPEYVHERYQRSYFAISDAQALRRLHNKEAIALIGIVTFAVAFAALRRN